MPTSPDKPYQAANLLRRGFKAEAERLAAHYRGVLGLEIFDPLPARMLAAQLNIPILTPREIPGMPTDLCETLTTGAGKDCWSGAIYMKNDKMYVIHNPTHSPARQESDLMHELAHAVCAHELNELETALTGMLIPLRKYDAVQEEEASYLGACMQLPREALFYHFYKKQKTEAQIAQLFNASLQMVKFRISITGIKKVKFRK